MSIDAIADNAPYTKSAATAAALPVVLDPGEEFDATIVFAPTTTGNNIDRTLAVTTTPANGDNQIDCEGRRGDGRGRDLDLAQHARVRDGGASRRPDARHFTVTNTGELDLTITIAAQPAIVRLWLGVDHRLQHSLSRSARRRLRAR